MRLAPLLLLLLAACTKPEDEAARRAREAREIEKRLGATKITLYRVLKTSLRSLPPRDAVRTAAGDKTELTRDEWRAIVEKDPALAAQKNRVGVFIVTIHAREGLVAGSGKMLAAAGATDPPAALPLPKTAAPFGGPSDFVADCRDILADDEDNHPTLAMGLTTAAQREKMLPPVVERLSKPAFEHALLGLAWLRFKPEFALYELHRCDPAALASPDTSVARVARSWIYTENDWHVHSLDELARIEDTKGSFASLKHALRYRNLMALERKDEAKRELELAREAAGDKAELAAAVHIFNAKRHFDDGRYREAAAEIRRGAEFLPEDKRAEAVAIAEKLERELPESTMPHHMAVWATRLLLRAAAEESLDPRLLEWGDGVRDRAHERVEEWEKQFPSADELKDKAGELWRRKTGR